MNSPYNSAFYEIHRYSSSKSAAEVLGFLFSFYRPKSVVDFGCGTGTWLDQAAALGADRICGFDGPWVLDCKLENAAIDFFAVDLSTPVRLSEHFDLAICLEVAEHLSRSAAPTLIKSLCCAADVVLFGAAIPDQGGTDHINEQWQSYWVTLFRKENFEPFDCIRPQVWDNQAVSYWYRQNVLLFVRDGSACIDRAALKSRERPIMDLVHPEQYVAKLTETRQQGRITAKRIVRSVLGHAAYDLASVLKTRLL